MSITVIGSISLNDIDILQIEGGIPSIDGLQAKQGCLAVGVIGSKGRIFSKVGSSNFDWSEIGVGDLILREVSTRSIDEIVNMNPSDLIHNQLTFLQQSGNRIACIYNANDGRWYNFLGEEINLFNHGVGPSGTYEESFENQNTGYWSYEITPWTIGSNTPSNNTGASFAPDGNYFAFCETSNPNGNATFILQTDYFNKATELSFYYHMYGVGMGSLFVEYYNGEGWQILDTISGQQQTSQNDPYLFSQYDLSSIRLSKVRLRYVGIGDYRGDLCIDKLKIVSV